jgi:hypothetical protein
VKPAEFLLHLRARGAEVSLDDGGVAIKSPPGVLTEKVRAYAKRCKPEIEAILRTEKPARVNAPPEAVSSVLGQPRNKERGIGGTPNPVSDELRDPFAGMDPSEMLAPFSSLIFAALDGELPTEPVQVSQGITASDPNGAVIAAARRYVQLHRAGQGDSASAIRELRTLAAF